MCCGGNVVQKATGAVKLVLAERKPSISLELIAERRAKCEACTEWEHGRCNVCGCYTWAKTRFRKETCPKGAW